MFEQDRRVKLFTLAATCFGLFMVMLDNTVVNLAQLARQVADSWPAQPLVEQPAPSIQEVSP